ncbi:hypothetical protein DOY81_013828, partial [Sarcophaga bullata]
LDTSEGVDTTGTSEDTQQVGNLEIYVELQQHNREKKTKSQQDIELAFKRRLNRDIKERQVLLHKVSLLCHFGRLLFYNRLLNDTILMNKALKMLPSQSAYPPERGTEIKYFQSMATWFKSAIKLKTQNLYPDKKTAKTKVKAHIELLKQIENKEARSKQDMIFILIILLRGMGLQCRLVVNIQPLPLKPAPSDLISIKMNKNDESDAKEKNLSKQNPDAKIEIEKKSASAQLEVEKQDNLRKEDKKEVLKKNIAKKQVNKDDEIGQCLNKISPGSTEAEKEHIDSKIDNKATTRLQVRNVKKTLSTEKSSSNSKKPPKENDENKRGKPKSTKILNDKQDNRITGMNDVLRTTNDLEAAEEEQGSSQKENKTNTSNRGSKRNKATDNSNNKLKSCKRPKIETGLAVIPKIVVQTAKGSKASTIELPSTSRQVRNSRSRSKSPQARISPTFLFQNTHYEEKFSGIIQQNKNIKNKVTRAKSQSKAKSKAKISVEFMKSTQQSDVQKRVLRSRQKTNETPNHAENPLQIQIPQLDGADDSNKNDLKSKVVKKKRLNIKKLNSKQNENNSDDDFEPSSPKKPKTAPALSKQDRRVLSSDEETDKVDSLDKAKRKQTAGDMWIEVWCDVEEQWVCVDIFKGKIHCVDTIRKSASPNLAYVFAF